MAEESDVLDILLLKVVKSVAARYPSLSNPERVIESCAVERFQASGADADTELVPNVDAAPPLETIPKDEVDTNE